MTENETNWIEIFIETNKEGFEPVSGIIYQCGITGVMIEDSDDFNEFLENPAREWDYIEDELVDKKKDAKDGITFFIRDNANDLETLNIIKDMLKTAKENEKEIDFGSLKMTAKNIKEEDWANNWKKYFKPFAVGDKIVIRPSWEEYDDDGTKKVLKIDPGHVFGTGTHETTQLCIELIENYMKEGKKHDLERTFTRQFFWRIRGTRQVAGKEKAVEYSREIDFIEAKDNKLEAFECKLNPHKKDSGGKDFREAYPNCPIHVVSPSNCLPFFETISP